MTDQQRVQLMEDPRTITDRAGLREERMRIEKAEKEVKKEQSIYDELNYKFHSTI